MQENKSSQIEVFLNSVPILASLSREEKLKLANALEEQTFEPDQNVVIEVKPSNCLIRTQDIKTSELLKQEQFLSSKSPMFGSSDATRQMSNA